MTAGQDTNESSHETEAVLWLGESDSAAALRRLVARDCRIVACAAQATAALSRALDEALTSLGAERLSLVAASDRATAALLLALERPGQVASIVLLAPRVFDPSGQPVAEPAARFNAIEAPMLALFGTKDIAAPPEAARHYRQHNPRCHLVFVYDADDAMAEERPEAVAELVVDFVKRRDRFLVRQHADMLYR
jgi:pimeloyl-ACP methyl ester carboxylesterase